MRSSAEHYSKYISNVLWGAARVPAHLLSEQSLSDVGYQSQNRLNWVKTAGVQSECGGDQFSCSSCVSNLLCLWNGVVAAGGTAGALLSLTLNGKRSWKFRVTGQIYLGRLSIEVHTCGQVKDTWCILGVLEPAVPSIWGTMLKTFLKLQFNFELHLNSTAFYTQTGALIRWQWNENSSTAAVSQPIFSCAVQLWALLFSGLFHGNVSRNNLNKKELLLYC